MTKCVSFKVHIDTWKLNLNIVYHIIIILMWGRYGQDYSHSMLGKKYFTQQARGRIGMPGKQQSAQYAEKHKNMQKQNYINAEKCC